MTRTGPWTIVLTFLYALALAGLAYQAVRPYLDAQGWMVAASLLSVAFLVYGAFTRVWPIAAVGQLFLGARALSFLLPARPRGFPVDLVGRGRARRWWSSPPPAPRTNGSGLFPEIPESWRGQFPRSLPMGISSWRCSALVRWVFGDRSGQGPNGRFPLPRHADSFRQRPRIPARFGVRCSFVLSAIGMWLYLDNLQTQAHAMATFLNGLAMLLFLAQPALLRHEGSISVTRLESWALILFSVATAGSSSPFGSGPGQSALPHDGLGALRALPFPVRLLVRRTTPALVRTRHPCRRDRACLSAAISGAFPVATVC